MITAATPPTLRLLFYKRASLDTANTIRACLVALSAETRESRFSQQGFKLALIIIAVLALVAEFVARAAGAVATVVTTSAVALPAKSRHSLPLAQMTTAVVACREPCVALTVVAIDIAAVSAVLAQ